MCKEIAKIEAAKRQLDCAIRLYYDEEDTLSIHTLAHASFMVLYDLLKESDTRGRYQDMQKNMEKIGWKNINQVPNFLKHADRDPGEKLPGHEPGQVEHLIGLSLIMYGEITRNVTPEMYVFHISTKIRYPDLFNLPPDEDAEFEDAFRKGAEHMKTADWSVQILPGKAFLIAVRESPELLEGKLELT